MTAKPRRAWPVGLAPLLLFASLFPTGASAFCNDACVPTRKPNFPQQQLIIMFTTGFSDGDENALASGVDYWADYFNDNNMTCPLQINFGGTYNVANVIVEIDPQLHDTGTAARFDHNNNDVNDPNGVLYINPDYLNHLGNGPLLTTVAAHELGHLLGFDDNFNSTCKYSTVMYGFIDPGNGPFYDGIATDCDYEAEDANYPPPPPPPPPLPDQCSADWVSGCSPIVINFDQGGDYELTGADSPVFFDMAGTGQLVQLGWTAAGRDEAFLWLDINHNGRVTGGAELFGNFTHLKDGQLARNGFEALKEYDDNDDDVIDENDAIWTRLMLWRDLNHNGICEPNEISPLAGSGVTAIDLHYHWSGRRDRWGNQFRYQSKIWIENHKGGDPKPKSLYDIFFVPVH